MRVFKSFFIIFGLLALNISFTGAYFSSKTTIEENIFAQENMENPPLPTPARIVINEVYYHPDENHGGINAEWIEIYNAGKSSIDIKDWYFENKTNNKETINQNYIIEPGQFVLIAANANTWNQNWDIIPSNAHKISLGGSLLFNGLVNTGDNLRLFDAKDNLIDGLSWGNDDTVLDPSTPAVALGHSISRKDAGIDTDTALDFEDLVIPSPGI